MEMTINFETNEINFLTLKKTKWVFSLTMNEQNEKTQMCPYL